MLLVVNGDRLYIGYDNVDLDPDLRGVQLFRTKVGITDPALESDFEQVSTSGFGDAANNKIIYNGLSIASAGADYLWILCGEGDDGKVRVYRTDNSPIE